MVPLTCFLVYPCDHLAERALTENIAELILVGDLGIRFPTHRRSVQLLQQTQENRDNNTRDAKDVMLAPSAKGTNTQLPLKGYYCDAPVSVCSEIRTHEPSNNRTSRNADLIERAIFPSPTSRGPLQKES